MGTRFTVGGIDFEALDYSVTEDSTGLSLNDSSGGTGEVRVSVAKPSPEETRNFPSPYPESQSLTPVAPAYSDDLDDLIYTPEYAGRGSASFSVVDIAESVHGVRRAVRVVVPPGTGALLLPNGGARVLRTGGGGEVEDFLQYAHMLPPVQGLDPQTGVTPRVGVSYIPRQTPHPGASYIRTGWPQNPLTVLLSSRPLDVEESRDGGSYNILTSGPAVPGVYITNGSVNSQDQVVDIAVLGVFASSSPYAGARDLMFTGFSNPSGYVTSWDSGSPRGLASRYEKSTPAVTPWVRALAPGVFEGMNFVLEDPRYGRVPGRVESVEETDDSWEFTCISMLGLLNSRNIELPPAEATASQILRDHVRVAGTPWVSVYVEPELDSEILRLPRRDGDTWSLLKQFAAGLGAEVSLVDGVVVMRRPRQLVTEPGRYFSRSVGPSGQDPKPGVILEVEPLNPSESSAFTGVNVYPQGFINRELPVISAEGGETIEVEITLNSETGGLFRPPFWERSVAVAVYDDLNNRVGVFDLNDGVSGSQSGPLSISAPRIWLENGWYVDHLGMSATGWSSLFSLSVQRVPSSRRTVLVTFRSPKVVDSEGRGRTFSLSNISGGAQVNGLTLYSTWAMRAGAITLPEFPTGARSSANEALDIIPSKSVSWTPGRISSVGYAASRRASGRYRTLSGTVDRLRPPYESNYYSAAPYENVREFVGTVTYSGVVSAYSPLVSPVSYTEVQKYWDQAYESSVKTWVFGNVSGSRVWDEASNNFYRIRSATITPNSISFTAETDTLHGDVDSKYQLDGLTYADVTFRSQDYVPLSYEQSSSSGYLKDPEYA